MIARNNDDLMNGADLRHEFEVFFLLFFGDDEWIEHELLFFAQHMKNVARRNAAEGIESIFWKSNAVAASDCLPGAPVQRHGVGERAIAVKDEAFNLDHGVGATQ